MPLTSPVELKRALVREGFEIYRTAGRFVLLADRVRDNLIMDSGVALGLAGGAAPGEADSGGNDDAPPESTRAVPSLHASVADAATDSSALVVRIVFKAQASEFPSDSAEQLIERARALATPFAGRGYQETNCQTVVVPDPGDPSRTLDTCYDVHWERPLTGLAAAAEELRFALGQQRTAGTGSDD